jgi:hypothetical protein
MPDIPAPMMSTSKSALADVSIEPIFADCLEVKE